MLEISQFRRKMQSHGLLKTLIYSVQFVLRSVISRLWFRPVVRTYSQKGEDLVIDGLLGYLRTGTYLDIGAYDPDRLSNTKRFYDRGWRGCNVEPNPRRFARFVRDRPEDMNLNVGVAESPGKLVFFDIVPEAYATFSEERAKKLISEGAKLRTTRDVEVVTMADLFQTFSPGRTVDFCTIDTEGMDLAVLKSNDWKRFRPRVLCVETGVLRNDPSDKVEGSPIDEFLAHVGYEKRHETIDFGAPLNGIYVTIE